jgi:hypothetical protein
MSSKHLVDPELTAFPAAPLDSVPIAELRQTWAAAAAPRPPPAPDAVVTEAFAPGRDGAPDVRLVITAPKEPGQNRPASCTSTAAAMCSARPR